MKPGVRRATIFRSTSARGLPLACTFRISSRPLMSGMSRVTWRSKRPGRRSAGSSTSGRLVAARMMIPELGSKPSISTSSWFSVCSRSSWPPPRPAPRWRPTASSSSTKTMQGAFFLAWSKRSRTRAAPTPTNISTKSEPLMLKNGTPASPATALASRVLPVPGAPDEQDALGDARAQFGEAFGLLQKLDDLGQFFLGLVLAGHVLEADLGLVVRMQAGAALAEGQRLVAAVLHLVEEEEHEAGDQDEWAGVGPSTSGQMLFPTGLYSYFTWYLSRNGSSRSVSIGPLVR